MGVDAVLADTPGLVQYQQEYGEVEFAELRAVNVNDDTETLRWKMCGMTESRAHCHIFEVAIKGSIYFPCLQRVFFFRLGPIREVANLFF